MTYSTLGRNAISWNDLIVTVIPRNGTPIEDIDAQALSASSARTRGVQIKRGRKFARSTGSVEHTASLTLYHSGWVALIASLVALAESLGYGGAQVDISQVEFDVIAKRKAPESDDFDVLKIKGCVIDDLGEDFSEGDDPDTIELELNPMQVVRMIDGKEVVLG